MLNIKSGKENRPVRMCIYGAEGIGKTTLASKAPFPLFCDLEQGTCQLDVRRISDITTWEGLKALPSQIDKSICQTLIIDTADRADAMCIEYVCRKHNVAGVESFGYGKGYTYVAEEFSSFLKELDKVIDAGINIIITAHGKLRKQELPDEEGAFDRWEMKLSKQVAPLIKEWVDVLLFCNFKTIVTQSADTKTKKASGGKRVMYSTHHSCWDAKNRFDLPNMMPLDFEQIKHLFLHGVSIEEQVPVKAQLNDSHTALLSMIKTVEKSGVTEEMIRKVVAKKGEYTENVPISEYSTEFIDTWLAPNWGNILSYIEKNFLNKK